MGLSARKRDDADEIAWIEEQLRRARMGTGDDVRFLDLTPYLIRNRYRDTGNIGNPNEYGWFGWDIASSEYLDDYATQVGLAGLMKVGQWVRGIGSARMLQMPYDPADRDRFYPSPTYLAGGNPFPSWATDTDDARLSLMMGMAKGLWNGINQDVFDAHGPGVGSAFYDATRIPVDFLPWPTGTAIRPLINRDDTGSSYCDGLELDLFAGTAGDALTTQIRESGGLFFLPDPADLSGFGGDDPNLIPSTQLQVLPNTGLIFGDYSIDLENIRYLSLDGHPDDYTLSSGDKIDFPFTD